MLEFHLSAFVHNIPNVIFSLASYFHFHIGNMYYNRKQPSKVRLKIILYLIFIRNRESKKAKLENLSLNRIMKYSNMINEGTLF